MNETFPSYSTTAVAGQRCVHHTCGPALLNCLPNWLPQSAPPRTPPDDKGIKSDIQMFRAVEYYTTSPREKRSHLVWLRLNEKLNFVLVGQERTNTNETPYRLQRG